MIRLLHWIAILPFSGFQVRICSIQDTHGSVSSFLFKSHEHQVDKQLQLTKRPRQNMSGYCIILNVFFTKYGTNTVHSKSFRSIMNHCPTQSRDTSNDSSTKYVKVSSLWNCGNCARPKTLHRRYTGDILPWQLLILRFGNGQILGRSSKKETWHPYLQKAVFFMHSPFRMDRKSGSGNSELIFHPNIEQCL